MTEQEPSLEQGKAPEVPEAAEPPKEFREYVRWRAGELPEEKEEVPAAAGADAAQQATEPPAKTAPDSEPDTQESEEDDETDKPKRTDSRVRKIDRLTRENAEWQQRHAELQQRLEALERKQSTAEEPGQKPKVPAEGKPKLEDFETLEAYQEALTDFKLEERDRARQAAEAERAAVEAHQKLQTDWAKRAKAAAKVHEDFDDVVDSVKAPQGPGVEAGRQAMLEDENGAEILYWLGKHPEELKRIAALSPVSAVREIGKLSAKFENSSTPENGKPKITGAPKPPPASTRPSKITSDSLDDPEVLKDYAKWERLRRAQLGRR